MDLLAPDVARIAPETAEPAPDRAPDELAGGTPEPLRSDLVALLGADRVLSRAIDIVSYASDASPYRLFPKAVVMARDAEDVSKVLAFGRERGIPVTLRAGGTSLNGQGQGDGIVVDVRRHWSGVKVEDGGRRARVRPGTVLGYANRVLARSWAEARARSRQHRHRLRRRGDRQQLRRDALRGHRRLLLDRRRADLRAAVGDDDRHRRARRRGGLRRRRAGPRRRASPRSATRSARTPS